MGYILYIIDGKRTPRQWEGGTPVLSPSIKHPLINETRPEGPDPRTVVMVKNDFSPYKFQYPL